MARKRSRKSAFQSKKRTTVVEVEPSIRFALACVGFEK